MPPAAQRNGNLRGFQGFRPQSDRDHRCFKIQAVADNFNFFLTNEEAKKIIEELDEDGNGYINWEEFRNGELHLRT